MTFINSITSVLKCHATKIYKGTGLGLRVVLTSVLNSGRESLTGLDKD
jgi:hypothetical protein